MRISPFFAASALALWAVAAGAAEPAGEARELDRDSLIELVSDKTQECRKEKDGSLCANYFSEDGIIKRVMYEDDARRDGVWFIDDEERLCILWQGTIKPQCFLVYEQDDGSYKMLKYDRHIATILGSEPGNSKNL